MTVFLDRRQVEALHRHGLDRFGGLDGLRDVNGLESALAAPSMAFGGADLHPTLAAKAAALDYALLKNHPFVDGNKRVAVAAMQTFLSLNGFLVVTDVNQFEQVVLDTAAGTPPRDDFAAWVAAYLTEFGP